MESENKDIPQRVENRLMYGIIVALKRLDENMYARHGEMIYEHRTCRSEKRLWRVAHQNYLPCRSRQVCRRNGNRAGREEKAMKS